jgi:hypothetical protein
MCTHAPWRTGEKHGDEWCCVSHGAAFIGALAYLGPKAGRDVFGISGETADLVFGAVTVATGVVGTLAGGLALDALGASMANGLALCAAGMLAGWVEHPLKNLCGDP